MITPFTTSPRHRRNIFATMKALRILEIHAEAIKISAECPVIHDAIFAQAYAESAQVAAATIDTVQTGGQLLPGKTYIIGER